MNYGIRALITPEVAQVNIYSAVGRIIQSAFTNKLEEDGVDTKSGFALEVYLKDLTEKEQKELAELRK